MDKIEKLKKSRQRKVDLIKYFGFVPLSVLRIKNPQITSRDIFNYQYENLKSTAAQHHQELKKYEYFEESWSGKGIGRGKTALSIMPAELVDFFIKFYAKKGDLYFDPFAGQGIQLQVANLRGIDYIGYDICEEYVNFIKSIIPKLRKNSKILEVHHKDSKKIDLPDNSVDFCFTSPPYWDIEFYDDNPEQLGWNKTYEEFLDGMKCVAKELYRVFKPSKNKDLKACVINTNDFLKNRKFYPYHADTIKIFQEVGWEIWDIWILDEVVSGLSKIFAVNKVLQKRAPRIHEYAMVFIKR